MYASDHQPSALTMCYAADPETGEHDVTIHRLCVQGKDEISMVYQGVFHSRPQDRVALGYVRASINRHLLEQQLQQQAQGLITDTDWELNQAEELWELAYTFQVKPWR